MLLLLIMLIILVDGDVYFSDRYRIDEPSDSLERMKPEDVYDSIRRTTADIRHYVKMESTTASPPSPKTSSSVPVSYTHLTLPTNREV